ncbi:hypothetical protein G6F64_011794 [Rhizopus arrhizus]|uniref:RGS domain-containing protein n=1 Tax=Rhizopus oryzae TaxID=64495 RepID=A0A9P7BLV4_RHIOR|nr:hypothetical protein G6F64_011794 [Rhizopus arrhizus]
MNRWSIKKANIAHHAHGIQKALEDDLSRKIQQDEKVQTGIAIPLTDLHSTNPYLSGMPMIQKPSRSTHGSMKTYGFRDPFASAPMEAWQEIKDYNLRVNGLPVLDQMMRLHTYSPLTQSHFAAFLRRRRVEQNLSFLMELETHEKLWRAYLQSIDRHNRQRLSRFLESAAEKEKKEKKGEEVMGSYRETPDTEDLLQSPLAHPTAPPFSTPLGGSDRSLSREDLVQNAHRIYQTYCAPQEVQQRIHLPEDYLAVLRDLQGRPEPIVFESAKTHVFEILNVFYYPLFVDEVLNENISLGTSRLSLVFGVLLLTLAYSLELSLVFLDSSSSRWFALIPFFFGWSALLTSVTKFAWWLGITSFR